MNFAATYCATSQKVSLKYFTKCGGGRQFSWADPGKISNSLESQLLRKKAQITIFCEFLLYGVVLFDVFYHNYHVWMEIVVQIKSHCDFPDFGQFCPIS